MTLIDNDFKVINSWAGGQTTIDKNSFGKLGKLTEASFVSPPYFNPLYSDTWKLIEWIG